MKTYQNNSYAADEAESCYRRLNTNFENPQITYKVVVFLDFKRLAWKFGLIFTIPVFVNQKFLLKLKPSSTFDNVGMKNLISTSTTWKNVRVKKHKLE